MVGDDARIVAVLRDLAWLGRRIGERAAELALLTEERGESTHRTPPGGTEGIVGAASRLAATAATLNGERSVDRDGIAVTRAWQVVETVPLPASLRAEPSDRDPDPRVGGGDEIPSAEGVADRVRAREASIPAWATDDCPVGAQPVQRTLDRRGTRRGGRGSAKPRLLGAVAVSSLVHLLVVVVLAFVVVAIDAEPVRIALTLGEAAGTEPALDDAAPLDMSVEEAPDVAADDVPLDAAPAEHALVEDLHAILETQAGAPAATEEPDPEAWSAGLGAVPAPGGGAEGAGGTGSPPGSGRVPQGSSTFFGRQGNARSVCFLCDNSNSYRDGGFHRVLDEIARAVDALSPQQSFSVIFFSDAAYPLFHPVAADALLAATPENKRRVGAWLGTVEMCSGGKGIDAALRLAGTLGADVIYLLSDGELASSVVERLAAADVGASAVHTFGLQQNLLDRRTGLPDPDKVLDQQRRNAALAAIATSHGGTFTPVAVPPQAALLEKTRPIRRNRTRGPVWGMGL